jgi:hypothetical protein
VDGDPSSRTQIDSGLLIRSVHESNSPGQATAYTSINDYEYNADKQLVRIELNSVSGTRTGKVITRFIRDSKGRIVTIENISKQFVNGVPYVSPEGIRDTNITDYVYKDESSDKILYSKRVYHVGNKTAKDSMVYEYNAAGDVAKTFQYYFPLAVYLPGDTMTLTNYSAYKFDASGNLTENALYSRSGGVFELNMRFRYEYDQKINPLYMDEDALVSFWPQHAPQNVVKQSVFIPQNGENYDNTAVYRYRSDDRPSSVAHFSAVVSGTNETTFYYK